MIPQRIASGPQCEVQAAFGLVECLKLACAGLSCHEHEIFPATFKNALECKDCLDGAAEWRRVSDFDVAIKGKGFFQITLPDGSTGYTRDGSFQVDSGGQLVTSAGLVLQPGITIPANAQKVTITQEGVVNVTVPGQTTPQAVGQITLANFINPAGLEPLGANLFGESASSGAPQAAAPGSNGLGTLHQGAVEGSNVNVVEELVAMIATQRAYELNSKAIQTSDQMLQKLGQL